MTIWKIKLSARASKTLKALDNQIKKRIETAIDELAKVQNPRANGKALLVYGVIGWAITGLFAKLKTVS